MTTDQFLPMDDNSATAVFDANGVDVTPRKDRGVFKVVRRQGLDGDRPMIGDKVTVHYTGKLLSGKKFDCSRERKEPFCFNVGKGQVLKAWDIGVMSMQRGEVCTLLCKPDYAYGPTGNPDKIPPNSSVVFEMELLNFEGEILTTDGGIVRRIKVKGEGYSNPNDGASVDVHLEGRCGDRLFDCRDVSFVVGEGEDKGIPLGVDRAMDKMQRGECCLLYLKPKYGFGSEGKSEYKVGPDKDIVYEVTLKDFKRAKESWEMDVNEKLDVVSVVKNKGNQYFKAGRHHQAVIQYQRIISWLEFECGTGIEQHKRIQDYVLTAHLNLALCFLRLKEFSQAVESCNKVSCVTLTAVHIDLHNLLPAMFSCRCMLNVSPHSCVCLCKVIEQDESNEKALYRRGEARLLRNEYSLAMADFQKVLEVNPSNRAARGQLSSCQSKMKEHQEQEKLIYANMFQKFADRDSKVCELSILG
uniref:peptidylprolyl isomerase n=1 Tax=Fundulus heteroclitus TaxID=8078 RepID=A0A3Q2QQE3_FUNHE